MPGPGMDVDDIEKIFSFHPPANDDIKDQHEAVREACKTAAKQILLLTPVCPEQTTAIRKLQEAMMFANAAIAIHESA